MTQPHAPAGRVDDLIVGSSLVDDCNPPLTDGCGWVITVVHGAPDLPPTW